MKKLVTFLCSAALIAGLSAVAGATIYPPGPGGTCPDTTTITNIQDPTQLCHPVATDSVYGVRGVVNAIDSIPTAFGFYMQLPAGGAYSGIDVFTSATNYQSSVPESPSGGHIFYGDLLSIDGAVAEFRGLTEILRRSSTDPIMIRRVSSGNPLPPYHFGTPLELDWVPGWTSVNGPANQEPWEGCLVRVRGPLVCARITGPGVGTNSMLISYPGGADSLCTDGFALTSAAALPVGTVIDSVQGVLSQTIISTVPSYRILLRNVNDLFAAAPPNVIDAYPVADNVIRVIFDRTVTTATAQNVSNYSLASFGSIDNATIEAGNKSVLVTITNGLAHGDAETITTSGITSTSGVTMTSGQPRSFFNGVLSIAEIQAPSPAGLSGAPCRDYTRFAGPNGSTGGRLSYTGIVTADFGTLFHMQDATGSSRDAFAVYGTPSPLLFGHKYLIAGAVQEFDGISSVIQAGFTEGVNTQYIQDLGVAAVPAPVVQTIATLTDTTCDASQSILNAEDFEGVLVTIKYVRVTENRTAGQSFLVAGPNPAFAPDTMLISNNNSSYTYAADSAHTVSVTGVLAFRNGNLPWRINPRDNNDIIDYGTIVGVGSRDGGADDLRLAVSPNPSRTARVSFTVPKSGKVDLGVFDLSGRRLATIISAQLPAGEYSKSWNGLDSNGSRVRSGVYFYRLKVGDQLVTTRSIKLD